ncbi:MAG: translocation/assembly module TamB domain-containing protein, partial [Candidatus Eremiobacteraeota bacterium]|nr:translocation/assembly module TamB domain-containing protein [Candidatus Eremiobacteraeota bacterium]
GTLRQPRLVGGLALQGGAYVGPFETEPISGVRAELAFDGSSARLSRFDANVGGGTLIGDGALTFPSLRSLETPVYDVGAEMNGVRVAFPAYGSGRLDGAVSLSRAAGEPAGTISGGIALSDASIPFNTFLKAGGGGQNSQFSVAPALAAAANASSPPGSVIQLPNWLSAFGLHVTATVGNNVRVRSPVLDIGGRGSVQIAGRVGDPTLDGTFQANPGGTLYLNRVFRVQDAVVRFRPENGILPYLLAHATTSVGYPSIDVTVTAQGFVPEVRLSYSSLPSYDEATIVGMLFDTAALGAWPATSLNAGPTTNILLPPNAFQQTAAGTYTLSQEAANVINTQFTARLLAPLEQGLGSAFGLSNLALNFGPTGVLGVEARRVVGPHVSFIYGESLSYPYRTTFGIESRSSPATSVVFTAYTQQGLYSFGGIRPDAVLSVNSKFGSVADLGGTQGFTVSIQRLFR